MLVVDLMHKFELSIWKALFLHIVRILQAENPALIDEMDHQFVILCDSLVHMY